MSEHSPKTAALMAYAEGRLGTAGTRRIEAHLDRCARCRRELAAIGAYEQASQEARALPAPELDRRRLDEALRAEATRAARRQRRRRRTPLALGALAAAATLALAWWGSTREPPRQVEAPAPQPEPPAPAPAPTEPQPEPLSAEVMARTGEVIRHVGGDAARPLALGDPLTEGDRLETAERAEAHLRFGAGTGFVVAADTEVALSRATTAAVRLTLSRGRLSNAVASEAPPERYEVAAEPFVVRVAGTRFAVARRKGAVGVRVAEGTVEVRRGERVVRTIQGPGTWSTDDTSPALEAPRGLEPGAPDWPAVKLSAPPRVRRWEVDAETFAAAGELAMRAPAGRLSVVALARGGRRLPLSLEVGEAGLALSETELHARLPEPVGFLPREDIARTLRAAHPALQSCYETSLRRQPDLQGQYTLRVRVGRSGVVQEAALSAPSDAPAPPAELTECLTRRLERRPFPEPRGGPVSFEVPLRFQPGSP